MATKKYRCVVCGYIHEGNEPPAVCPMCGATSDKFELIEGGGEPAKKKMDTNSNSYTIIYATIVVVIVAFMLAFVSSALREKQDKNIEFDKMKQILSALNVTDVKDPQAEYDKYIKADMIVNIQGEVVKENGGFVVKNDQVSPENLPVYVAEVNGATKYVVPVFGNGLWGGIWGYIGLNDDKNTVFGTYFSHQSETPGLGAEIAGTKFQQPFIGKKVMKEGEVALSVVKGKLSDEEYQVNGISGGTVTSNGVDAMIKKCLGEYKAFLATQAMDAETTDAIEAAQVVDDENVEPANSKEE